jgi:hypothetical protein
VHFVTKISSYFCNLHKICVFWCMTWPGSEEKKFHLYVVPDRKSRDLSSSAFWPYNFFPIFFGPFTLKWTLLRGTYIQNIKKVKNQPTLMYICIYIHILYIYIPIDGHVCWDSKRRLTLITSCNVCRQGKQSSVSVYVDINWNGSICIDM